MVTGGGKTHTSAPIAAAGVQQVLRALASAIKTDDELIGNAVESAATGEAYPNSNWVLKGEDNRTTGWIRLIMR